MSALLNDVVMSEDIVIENAQGVLEPIPAGTVFTGTSNDPSGACNVGVDSVTGNQVRLVNALHQSGTFTATVSTVFPAALNMAPVSDWVEVFVIGPDNTPTQTAGNPTSIKTVSQPLPPV